MLIDIKKQADDAGVLLQGTGLSQQHKGEASMSRNTHDFIQRRKRDDEQALGKRLAELQGLGLEKEKIDKDPRLRHLRAKIKQAKRRLAAIAGIEDRMKAAAIRKAEGHKRERPANKIKKPKKPSRRRALIDSEMAEEREAS
jgi:hypothetical protein